MAAKCVRSVGAWPVAPATNEGASPTEAALLKLRAEFQAWRGQEQTYEAKNTTQHVAKILFEEDPEALVEVGAADVQVSIETGGAIALPGATARVGHYQPRGGSRPPQEIVLIPGQAKKVLMKSSTVLYSAAFLHDGIYSVYKTREAVSAEQPPVQVLERHYSSPDMKRVKADSLLSAITQLAEAPQSIPQAVQQLPGGCAALAAGSDTTTTPLGFLPTSIPVQVYSNSLQAWHSGCLLGVAINCTGGHLPGSVYVSSQSGTEQRTKTVTPSEMETVLAGGGDPTTMPPGFLPTSVPVQVYSTSLQTWHSGCLLGVAINSTGGYLPGSLYVFSQVGGVKRTKILKPRNAKDVETPSEIETFLRASS